VKGRTIFGGIVPFGQVWRAGANQATKISFSTPVKLEGNEIPAGNYSLFAIPGEQEWTIIINKNTNQWGAFQYHTNDDLVRFTVTPVTLRDTSIETYAIEFNRIHDESALLELVWDKTVVPIRLTVEVAEKLVPQIEAAMAVPGKKQDAFYFQAATFYYNHDLDSKKALEWINAALESNSRIAYEYLHLKAQILAKQGDKAGAIAAAKQSTELAIKAEGSGSSFVKMNQDLISSQQ
jgi:tetratricopeptide (TPR) repeat protein